jgi:hypothetical protein
MLTDNGIKKGLTKEKIDGTYQRPKHITPEFLDTARKEYLVETIKQFLDEYPNMFRRQPELREKFINRLKGARIKLRKYPEVIKAMYENEPDKIPEDL